MEPGESDTRAIRNAVDKLLGTDWQNKSWDELFVDKLQGETRDMPRVNVILFGLGGVGKSTLINNILRRPLAPVGVGDPVTMVVEKYEQPGIPITLFDTR